MNRCFCVDELTFRYFNGRPIKESNFVSFQQQGDTYAIIINQVRARLRNAL